MLCALLLVNRRIEKGKNPHFYPPFTFLLYIVVALKPRMPSCILFDPYSQACDRPPLSPLEEAHFSKPPLSPLEEATRLLYFRKSWEMSFLCTESIFHKGHNFFLPAAQFLEQISFPKFLACGAQHY